jgi:hypothetical protein
MPPYYLSPEWVQAFNAALAEVDLTAAVAAAGSGSLTAAHGTFAVAQIISDPPAAIDAAGGGAGRAGAGGEGVRAVLTVADGRMAFALDPAGALPANVTIVLTYADAVAIARGALVPATALADGRVRVRGELAVLVAGQAVLAAAAAALGKTLTELTDPDDSADRDR